MPSVQMNWGKLGSELKGGAKSMLDAANTSVGGKSSDSESKSSGRKVGSMLRKGAKLGIGKMRGKPRPVKIPSGKVGI
jgi:hypothetical protein